ncbi:Solute carrier family 22 member 13 [Exaiptasia diaphana]|nr:Solute carrier family 22 member 13 [Exaiptasia diaphana]
MLSKPTELHSTSSVSTFVLMMENINVKQRAGAAACSSFAFSIGMMILALLGFLPESFRWFIVKGKNSKAFESFQKIAKFNGKKMPENEIEFVEESQRVGDLRDLFRSLHMAKITIAISFAWIVITMVFYGSSFSAGIFGGNRYLVFFFMAAVEIPASISSVFLMNRAGRKKVMSLGLIISAIASLGAVLLQNNKSNSAFFVGQIVMTVVSKYFICLAFQVAIVYTTELFPTVVRSVGFGTASGSGRIGAICAPFIVWLVRIHILLPYSIFAISAFIAGILSLTLPETNNKPTKETIEINERALNTDKS